MNNIHAKGTVMDYVYQYSKYYGLLLGNCDEIAFEVSGHAGLIYLFNLTEMIFKDSINEYEFNLFDTVCELRKKGYISNTECHFLNNPYNGIRKYRNIFAHSNLAKYNIIFSNEPNVLYPLTENETCIKLYKLYSDIIFNIILKVVSANLIVSFDINLDNIINNLNVEIIEISPKELLKITGFSEKDFNTLKDLDIDDNTIYRLSENSGNVKIYEEIFKNLFNIKK